MFGPKMSQLTNTGPRAHRPEVKYETIQDAITGELRKVRLDHTGAPITKVYVQQKREKRGNASHCQQSAKGFALILIIP